VCLPTKRKPGPLWRQSNRFTAKKQKFMKNAYISRGNAGF
jgi:hypothetical protein